MRSLERHYPAWMLSAVVLYVLMFAAFSYVKRDPRPSAWLTSVADRHYERLCRGEGDVWPKRDDSARNCARELRESAMMAALFAPLPLGILLGSLLGVLTQLGLGALVIRTSSPLCATVKKGLGLVKSEPSVLSLPALACAVVSALLGLVFWRAFSDPRALELSHSGYAGFAWVVILSPAVLIGYFAVAYLLLLSNAALIHAYLEHAAGRRASLERSIAAAARLAPQIALLSSLVFGFLLLLSFAVGRRRGGAFESGGSFLGVASGEASRFTGFFIESGLLIGTQLVVAAMIEERLSLLAAVRRVSGLVKPAGREVLTAAFGMATMRYDACAMALVGPIMAGFMCLPLYIDAFALGFSLTLTAGILCGSLYFALLSSLEGVFAAGIFAYASGGVVLPGLERHELRAFIEGLDAAAAR